MKYEALKTSYYETMDKNTPWCEYPRPNLIRNSFICLNGLWDFAINTSDERPAVFDKKILVPFPPESLLSGLEATLSAGELLHYKSTFTSEGVPSGGRAILHFGAVDQICEVYLNGTHIGAHYMPYLPFEFDITDILCKGENEIYVRCTDSLDLKYPYGKQKKKRGGMWYTPVSGIWQTVWIEYVPTDYIKDIKITTDTECAIIKIIGGADKKTLTLDTGEVYEFSGDEITVRPERPELWSPENPKLYNFTVCSGDDCVKSYFALREISVKSIDGASRLCLNGEPYIFNGLLDQGYYPDGIFLPATYKGYEDDILLAKRLGFNMLRKHIKLEPKIFYHLCDKHGIAVFQDMINNSDYSFIRDTALPTVGLKRIPDGHLHKSKEARAIFEECTRGIIKELQAFPSVLYYTVFNEGWGQFCADKMYSLVKELDGTRIIDATSGWFARKLSDVDSRHIYFKKIKLGKLKDRPLVISEFGGYSCRIYEHLFGDANYGYRQFSSCEEFEAAFISLYENEVIPIMRAGGCAFVYTQLSDVEDETNGLITYDRKFLKVNEEKIFNLMNKISGKLI